MDSPQWLPRNNFSSLDLSSFSKPTPNNYLDSCTSTPGSNSGGSSTLSEYRDTLILSWAEHDISYQIPEDLKFLALRSRDEFLRKLSAAPSQQDQQPFPEFKTKLHLAAAFLEYLALTLLNLAVVERAAEEELLAVLLDNFERDQLELSDIHVRAGESKEDEATQLKIIKAYNRACGALGRQKARSENALLNSAASGKSKLFAILGGQGTNKNYLDEFRTLFETYHHQVSDFVQPLSKLLEELSSHPEARKHYPEGLHLSQWLENVNSAPNVNYLGSAPISFPLIGGLQLLHYVVCLKVLGIEPYQFQKSLAGVTGHSQGIVVAAVISSADSWSSLYRLSEIALRTLFWIGVRSQQSCPVLSIDPAIVQDSIENGEGTPSSMLSIKGLSISQLTFHVDAVNSHLSALEKVTISLHNGPRTFVVSGPTMSLYGLNVRLRQYKVSQDSDQGRIPFRERKLEISNSFIPVTAPFHSQSLETAVDLVVADLGDVHILDSDLQVSLFDTFTGKDVCSNGSQNIIPRLVRSIMVDPVHWTKAVQFPNATHIIDFGPGGNTSIGNMTSQVKAGTGVRIISACDIAPISTYVGCKAELFQQSEECITRILSWDREFAPGLVRDSAGHIFVDTRMSRLLSLPPIMVAGMTPTTVAPELVIATMNAGFHIELAGGGYFRPADLESALYRISSAVPVGRGITVNLIYANSRAIQWQIPLLTKLRKAGVPIEGLTFGAGVPSAEVMTDIIGDLGLQYVSLKPGSKKAIEATIAVAKAHSSFPIILQWTGGRAGGHHSFEDFHDPILQMYARIRECKNIILVAGSGFGGSKDIFPYITGTWSEAYDYPVMPFDGALLGSRMMTAMEALTSMGAKKAIVAAAGVDDSMWDSTYKSPTSGVLTVISALGEPIHMLATRGVKFWAEMDNIFKLDKSKRLPTLIKKRDYIISKLNSDYQRVWFGQKDGVAAELTDMSYHDFLTRMVQLMYLQDKHQWIDNSWKILTFDFARRLEERFSIGNGGLPVVRNISDLEDPETAIKKISAAYPSIHDQLVTSLDIQHFLDLCLRRGQKPVPFIPAINENFEFHFKTDSLWQSENLEAVIDGDVERTCVLHGPVAAQHSKSFNEPVRDILNSINDELILMIKAKNSQQGKQDIHRVEYLNWNPELVDDKIENKAVVIKRVHDTVTYEISSSTDVELPPTEEWFTLIGGPKKSWRRALLESKYLVVNCKHQPNAIRSICTPAHGLSVTIQRPDDPSKTLMVIEEDTKLSNRPTSVEIRMENNNQICVNLWHGTSRDGTLELLGLKYSYHPEAGYAPIREITENRLVNMSSFYQRLWFGDQTFDLNRSITEDFSSEKTLVTPQSIREFCDSIGNGNPAFLERPGMSTFAPLDYAIVLVWKVLLQPVLLTAVGGDMLKLVHLSNSFAMVPGETPIQAGDTVEASSKILSVRIQESGKVIRVRATVMRNEKPVVVVTSSFLYRGVYSDFESTFEIEDKKAMHVTLSTAKDIAILRSKEWAQINLADEDLIGKTLLFYPESRYRFKTETTYKSVEVSGNIFLSARANKIALRRGSIHMVGEIQYSSGESYGDPVNHYLQKYGAAEISASPLKNKIPLHGQNLSFITPQSATEYSCASKDFNPIHVSPIFASLANLPGPIHHGMWTSGAVRSLIETAITKNNHQAFHSFSTSFVGMVRPGDEIEVELHHTGMLKGRQVIEVLARNKSSGATVLTGEAEVEQSHAAYLFTGQGSQKQGMGMDLYESSPVAKALWDRADAFYSNTYGFKLTEIVRHNPKELTVYFGGVKGRKIRDNYRRMTIQVIDENGNPSTIPIFDDIAEDSLSYTHRSYKGLLFATQFAQPALTIFELAQLKDMEYKGLVPSKSSFAGHSLGEFPALVAFADIMTLEQVTAVVFLRGLAMHKTVPRDEVGSSNFSMSAVNPSRVSKFFTEDALSDVIKKITDSTGMLLEIVNYNISNRQYVCAGELRALDSLQAMIGYIASSKTKFEWLHGEASTKESEFYEELRRFTSECVDKPDPIVLKPATGITPLVGIDVPFHSTYLRTGIPNFRDFLRQQIDQPRLNPQGLIDRWIPNLIGKPFSIEREYVERVFNLTRSVALKQLLLRY